MRLLIKIICLLVLIILLGCRTKTEQIKTDDSLQAEVTSSTDTTAAEEIPVQEVKTPVTKIQTEKTANGKLADKTEPVEPVMSTYKVTFLEIGSVNCIPCKMMKPIMKDIEEEYKGIVRVDFYDLNEPAGRTVGQKYNIRVMPTQVFLDADGNEFFRHEGFYPKEELSKMLDAYLAKLPN